MSAVVGGGEGGERSGYVEHLSVQQSGDDLHSHSHRYTCATKTGSLHRRTY